MLSVVCIKLFYVKAILNLVKAGVAQIDLIRSNTQRERRERECWGIEIKTGRGGGKERGVCVEGRVINCI